MRNSRAGGRNKKITQRLKCKVRGSGEVRWTGGGAPSCRPVGVGAVGIRVAMGHSAPSKATLVLWAQEECRLLPTCSSRQRGLWPSQGGGREVGA